MQNVLQKISSDPNEKYERFKDELQTGNGNSTLTGNRNLRPENPVRDKVEENQL